MHMRLSELPMRKEDLLRDGEFASIGIAKEGKPKSLVAIRTSEEFELAIRSSSVSCIIVRRDSPREAPSNLGTLLSDDPETALFEIHNHLASNADFYPGGKGNEISRSAKVHPTAFIAETDVRIGSNCEIAPRAVIMERSVLEDGVKIGPGTVIGGEAVRACRKGAQMVPVVSTGGVQLRKKVEIHANCLVDRATFGGRTEIGEYSRFDNMVSVSQNSKLGRRTIVTACSVIGENVVMGDDVWVGPNATVSDEIRIGDSAFITIGAVVVEDVPPHKKVSGNYAIDHQKFIEFIKKIR